MVAIAGVNAVAFALVRSVGVRRVLAGCRWGCGGAAVLGGAVLAGGVEGGAGSYLLAETALPPALLSPIEGR